VIRWRFTISVFRVEKKLSATALSHTVVAD